MRDEDNPIQPSMSRRGERPPEPIYILCMEDDSGLARLIQKRLEWEGCIVDLARDGEEGLAMHAAGSYDVILLDQSMPVQGGLEVLRILASQGPLPPTIMVTGTGSEQVAVEAMKLGARDYIVKDVGGRYLDLLPTVIGQVLRQQHLVEEKRQAEETLRKAYDELEGQVKERTAELTMANERLEREIEERKQAEEALRESEGWFRSLFENAPLSIFEIDLEQNPPAIIRANRQARQVYGWSSVEFASVSMDKIFPPAAIPELARMVDALRAGETVTVESVNQRRDGSVFPVRISAASDVVSGLNRVILTLEDITAEKARRSEEEAIAEERRRIAREIHDGLAQDLASLRFRAGLWHDLVDNDPAQMHAELDALQDLLRENIREVRRSIFALRPVALDELGFFPALHQFVHDFGEQNQLHVDLRILGPQNRLPQPLEPVLFRIIQETLNNVGKHAQASMIWVVLDLEAADAVTLTVRDDGVGFDPASLDQAVQRGHLGLTQMRERVEGLEGTLLLRSQPGKGTEVQIVLPLFTP